MKIEARLAVAKKKLRYYGEEIYALKDAGIWYKVFFGLLVIVLFPLLIVEVIVFMLTGKDFGIFQSTEPVVESVLNVAEVPDSLRNLVPLAKKWGIGDDGDRGDILEAASAQELEELGKRVGPRMQEIADWLDTYSEEQMAQSDTAGFYLYLMCAYEEAALDKEEK